MLSVINVQYKRDHIQLVSSPSVTAKQRARLAPPGRRISRTLGCSCETFECPLFQLPRVFIGPLLAELPRTVMRQRGGQLAAVNGASGGRAYRNPLFEAHLTGDGWPNLAERQNRLNAGSAKPGPTSGCRAADVF